jgi:hypothetical protein
MAFSNLIEVVREAKTIIYYAPFVCWKVVFFWKVVFLKNEFLKSELFFDVW